MDKCHTGRHFGAQQSRDFREKDGRKVRAPVIYRLPNVIRDKHRVDAKVALHCRAHIRVVAQGQDLDNGYVFD